VVERNEEDRWVLGRRTRGRRGRKKMKNSGLRFCDWLGASLLGKVLGLDE
jgi:hypothetical protein